ncbi:MAG: NADAR family protein [Candidatus Paceibacterota bacterium]
MFVLKGKNTYSEEILNPVLFYGGELGYCFSNFSAFNVVWKNRTWQTSEHAFQAAGFDDVSIVEEIANANSAHDALKLAIKYSDRLRPTWENEKRSIMKDICRKKLHQHEYIKKTLLQTKNHRLVEDSPKDGYWGCGANGLGKNWLGKIWMELRSELTEE